MFCLENKKMMLIEINDGLIEELLKCKKYHKKFDRDFSKWELNSLLVEAIIEFKNKYK